ncbi:hypothetical protein FRC12_003874 [Ceratobasidium sp. 428]|nr:hypothetical protein FRC12_003874 [Ceratobasidium sp. 428]
MALDPLAVRSEPELPTIGVSVAEIAQLLITHPNDDSWQIHPFSQSPPTLIQPIALVIESSTSHIVPTPRLLSLLDYGNPCLAPNVYALNALLVVATTSASLHPAKPSCLTEYGLCLFGTVSTVLPPAVSTAISDDAGSVLPSTTLLHACERRRSF